MPVSSVFQGMRTSLNVPEELLTTFDETWQAEGIDSRSRAVREAMQEYVEAHAGLEAVDGDVVAVIAFDYNHHEVIEPVHDIQHEYGDVITGASHVHQDDWCLETVFCDGSAAAVRELVYRLRDFDGVHRVSVFSLHDGSVGDAVRQRS